MTYRFNDNSTPQMPNHAIVLAAGIGKRMLPLTEAMPKPLLTLGHQRIIDYTLDKFEESGIANVVVNAHYKADMLKEHLERRAVGIHKPVEVSEEEELLETGGGIKLALPLLGGGGKFFVANADSVWTDGAIPALERMASLWGEQDMDALLLVVKTPQGDTGDYSIHPHTDQLTHHAGGDFMYAGLALVHPRLFRNSPEGAFSLKLLFDHAERDRRLFGVKHNGKWFHLGTPEALSRADAEFRAYNL